MGELSNWPIPDLPLTLKASGWKVVPLSNCCQAVGDDEWKCPKHIWEHSGWLGSIRQSPKWVNTDRAQYVLSSSGLISNVVMILWFVVFEVKPDKVQRLYIKPNVWPNDSIYASVDFDTPAEDKNMLYLITVNCSEVQFFNVSSVSFLIHFVVTFDILCFEKIWINISVGRILCWRYFLP